MNKMQASHHQARLQSSTHYDYRGENMADGKAKANKLPCPTSTLLYHPIEVPRPVGHDPLLTSDFVKKAVMHQEDV